MKMVRWNQPTAFPAVYTDMARLLDSFLGEGRGATGLQKFDWAPRVDVEEFDDRLEITAEIPGMEKDNINIEVQEGILTIRGERKFENDKKEKNYHICERRYGTFARSFALPENVKEEDVEAEYKDGVLKLTVPKTEPVKPKEIKIKVK